MLPLHTLLNHLTTLQSLKVERLLQQTVNFDSKSLLVFNSMMLGQTAEEIKEECHLSDENYPRYERPIYNCILELYNLKAETTKDNLLIDAYYAVNETSHESDFEKAKNLEKIFHQLKKHNIEQESVDLLLELHKLHLGTPLQAVYQHLYAKYKNIQEANNQAFKIFECLNKKLSSYLKNDSNNSLMRSMILDYKEIRMMNEEFENKTLSAILNLSKLLLVTLGNQKQLLKDKNLNLNDLLAQAKIQIGELPFGVEKYFLTNIIEQVDLLVKKQLAIVANFPVSEKKHPRYTESNNFSFPNEVYHHISQEKTLIAKNKNNGRKGKGLSRNFNLSSFVDTKINSFSFSGDSWSISST